MNPSNAQVARAMAPITASVREKIGKGLKSKQMFVLLAETFQALGDSSRIQIVWALSHGELCVGDIAELVAMSQPAVSHHLRTLRNLKLVKTRREGRTLHYSLDDEHIEHLLHEGIKHVEDFL
jgi:DNA-binding transcriptional ArsR family regulator